ncbi:geranylgeranyl diphosphate synthase type I [Microbacteriaceae bacterium MWH-Ta3]|nr:geranylgeranyl diphosphate synthase type I [Microbacteriaceae bacterium MWH-Ta3]
MSQAPLITDAVTARIDALVSQRRDEMHAISPDTLEMNHIAAGLLSGGKRFRARLAYWGWRASVLAHDPASDVATHTGRSAIEALATGLEIFHAAALVHDDLMDNSDTRRGMPAAHRRFETHHRESQLAGNGQHFGLAGSILLGDLLLAWSDDLFLEAALTLPQAPAQVFRTELRTMRTDVTVGQYLDVFESVAWPHVADADALRRAQQVVVYKSAKYSMEAPLVLGALLAGASPELVASLRAFALPLGFAFQLRDDLLGVFGDEATTGKPAGDDLREGKRTVLLAIARQRADRSTRDLLDELVGDPELSREQIDMLRQTLQDNGAVDEVEALIERSRVRSLEALAGASLDSQSRHELTALVDAITRRAV